MSVDFVKNNIPLLTDLSQAPRATYRKRIAELDLEQFNILLELVHNYANNKDLAKVAKSNERTYLRARRGLINKLLLPTVSKERKTRLLIDYGPTFLRKLLAVVRRYLQV
jgi:hypothetical protein